MRGEIAFTVESIRAENISSRMKSMNPEREGRPFQRVIAKIFVIMTKFKVKHFPHQRGCILVVKCLPLLIYYTHLDWSENREQVKSNMLEVMLFSIPVLLDQCRYREGDNEAAFLLRCKQLLKLISQYSSAHTGW